MIRVLQAAIAMTKSSDMHVTVDLLGFDAAVESTCWTILDGFLGFLETITRTRRSEPLPAFPAILYNTTEGALLFVAHLMVFLRLKGGTILLYSIAQLQPVAYSIPYVYIKVMAGHSDCEIDVQLHFSLCGGIYAELIFVVSIQPFADFMKHKQH